MIQISYEKIVRGKWRERNMTPYNLFLKFFSARNTTGGGGTRGHGEIQPMAQKYFKLYDLNSYKSILCNEVVEMYFI